MLQRRPLRFALAAVVVLTGCNALLDVKDIYLEADASAPGAEGGTADGNVSGPDSSFVDGSVDGAACQSNLQNDPEHCGRCGHDCLGGSCTGGRCDAVVLAPNLTTPSGIAVGADDVYFTTYESGTVQSVKKSGGAVTTLASGEVRARGVAVNAGTLYWANGDFTADDAGYKGGIWKCALPACTARTYVAAGDYDTAYPTVHGAFLYFGTGEDDTVMRVPLAGGGASTVATTARPFGIAVDDTHAYYTSEQANLYRAPLVGGSPEAVGPTIGPTTGFVAVDDQRVYWAHTDATGNGLVWSTAKATLGGAPTTYGSAQDNVSPVGIAVDAENVYWSTAGSVVAGVPAGDGKVLTCKKVGCGGAPPVVLATGNANGGQLVLDELAVYWVEFGAAGATTGRIRKVAKP